MWGLALMAATSAITPDFSDIPWDFKS